MDKLTKIEHEIIDLARANKPFDKIYSKENKEILKDLTQGQKDGLRRLYREAYDYFRWWEIEEANSKIEGLENLV